VPRVLVTDKLASYGVTHRRLMRSVEHRRSKHLNNRAENSHQPTRQRGTSHETVHLTRARPAVPGRVQRHLPALPTWPPPTRRPGIPTRNDRPIYHLERGHRHGHSGLTQATQTDPSDPTMPVPPDNFSKLTVPGAAPDSRKVRQSPEFLRSTTTGEPDGPNRSSTDASVPHSVRS
jgi:putative transposase